jgi:hypothetical protein
MRPLVGLGLRLARAGGRLRAWSIAGGNAIGVILLLAALALPAAIYPDAQARADAKVQLMAVLLFLLVPASILLITVGRLSSGVRDRRLAALRMIGVSPHRARLAAAVENGSLALVGGLAGALLFELVAAPVSRLIAAGPRWFAAPLRVPAATCALVVAGVTALSVAVGTAATWERQLPGAARSESTRRAPRPSRLVVLGLGLAALVWLAHVDERTANPVLVVVLFLGGGLLAAVGIALVTPLLTGWVSGLLVRSRAAAATLAGRAMQTDAAGASRVVAGLGVAVFLVVAGLGTLGAVENTPQNRYALQVVGDGPQRIWLWAGAAGDTGARLSADDLSSLSRVPGVHGVIPQFGAQADCGADAEHGGCPQVFVGTCAELALGMAVTGCDDGRAARIVADTTGLATDLDVYVPEPFQGATLPLLLDTGDGTRVTRAIPLAEPPVVEDVAGTLRTWVWAADGVAFVPVAFVRDVVGDPQRVDVVADGGTAVQQRVAAWAQQHGHTAEAYPTGDLDQVRAARVVVWTLCGIALGVALLVLALTAADRAIERRRNVARQIAVGVPARVLRAGQLLQVLVPLTVAVALAVGAGLVLLRGYAHVAGTTQVGAGSGSGVVRGLAEIHQLVAPGSWVALGAVVLVGALLVALSTVPLIRTRLTPELLRRE